MYHTTKNYGFLNHWIIKRLQIIIVVKHVITSTTDISDGVNGSRPMYFMIMNHGLPTTSAASTEFQFLNLLSSPVVAW
jgi:hypothetical protein